MNVLFLTLLDFNSIDEHNIYTDLLREFVKHGHEVYVISPVERRKKQKTKLLRGEKATILKLRIGNTQKTNIIEKGISTINIESVEHYQRGNVEGFDLNRDGTYQTQIESQVATADLVKWKPVTLMELHGFIYYARTQLQIEPCTPPHEPNLEYDLFMNYALEGQ